MRLDVAAVLAVAAYLAVLVLLVGSFGADASGAAVIGLRLIVPLGLMISLFIAHRYRRGRAKSVAEDASSCGRASPGYRNALLVVFGAAIGFTVYTVLIWSGAVDR